MLARRGASAFVVLQLFVTAACGTATAEKEPKQKMHPQAQDRQANVFAVNDAYAWGAHELEKFFAGLWANDLVAWSSAYEAEQAAARVGSFVSRQMSAPVNAGGGGGSCANPVVPEHVARAESGCDYGAYNPTGCSGGCIGFYQISREHYGAGGTCAGMGTSPGEQDACAQRIKDSSGCGAWTTWC